MAESSNEPDLFRQTEGGLEPTLRLRVLTQTNHQWVHLTWTEKATGSVVASAHVFFNFAGFAFIDVAWNVTLHGQASERFSSHHRSSIRSELRQLRKELPVADEDVFAEVTTAEAPPANDAGGTPLELPEGIALWLWIERQIGTMVDHQRLRRPARPPGPRFAQPRPAPAPEISPTSRNVRPPPPVDPELARILEKQKRKAAEEREKHRELKARIRANQLWQLERQREREERKLRAAERAAAQTQEAIHAAKAKPPLVVPDVPVKFEVDLQLQETLAPLTNLNTYLLRERAALWWVSNQSDDLLALPYCHIQRLEYQIRTALRTIGPLRGRALLSDEVGLGKTIEAGLVLKEYLTRGMVKRFLILTVPSLVDQWEEELSEKFDLATVTTNQTQARNDPEKFWRESPGIVASLHTLKQPAHLAVAQSVQWDMLIVDEAHYLRNRSSQAWQAVNVLPRQFLLLLTATPVQNSLEELYNLVTLLQPGQLPSPKEFRARFIDPKKPHQPREPEELRRLLGQVMIRNTRANAGINLPPRRAETVLFEPSEAEKGFWIEWEAELRQQLAQLSSSQANLWGRLLLQSAGSSPAAWLETLKSFPNRAAARAWSERAPLEESWQKKSQSLQPLTKGEGGVVIFTQFLQTQAAIAAELRAAGTPTFVINGQTPPRDRQPITESFREQGGALLLTHSGTEGRNLQFSHRLVNFDLPWNPMEIEQRIGRLHRLGQQHPVRIYNLVQAGTLQEHLLEILQEKLNLFELVVGETGLILGERFTSDEFAEEILRRWRESEGRVAEAMHALGDELAAARKQYDEIKTLDETLFAKDYESL